MKTKNIEDLSVTSLKASNFYKGDSHVESKKNLLQGDFKNQGFMGIGKKNF